MSGGVSVIGLSEVPVGWLVWHRPPNIPVLTVVCRATFSLQPGEATLAPEQEPPSAVERPYPDGASRGLYAPADLVPLKPRADVVLVGSAHAPGGQPARSFFVRLTVGEVDKSIEVFGDRHFDLQGELREGPRIASMPIVYERAAGGPDTANPIGVRPGPRDTYGHLALPNLQPTGLEIAAPTDVIAPVCFGPISGGWPTRAALLGPTASARPSAEWQGQLVPADLDPAYFNAAPRDQQVQALREDERIALENLHPEHANLVTRLPGLRPHAFVEGRGPTPLPVAMRADTLWIEAARGIATLTWRGQVLLDHAGQSVRVLVTTAPAGRSLTWANLESLARAAAPSTAPPRALLRTLQMTVPTAPSAERAVLPFAHVAAPPSPQAPAAPPADPRSALPFRAPGAVSTMGETPKPPARPVTMGETPKPPAPVLQAAPPLPNEEGDTVDEPVHSVTLVTFPPGPAPVAPADIPAPPPPVAQPVESPWARGTPSGVGGETARPLVQLVAAPVATPVVPAAPPAVQPAARAAAVDALTLIAFDPVVLPGLRRDPRFAPIIEAVGEQPLDPDLDHPELEDPAADMEDRREVFEVLARGAASGEEAIAAALAAAVRDDGRLVHPIVLVTGELRFAFDELEALKATLSAAAAHAGADVEAKRILDLGREFLGTPGLPGAAAVAEGLATRVRDTFEKRGLVPAGYLDAQVERALLGGRHFQERSIFGATHRRALFPVAPDRPPIPAYLAGDLADPLPATPRLRVRMLAHVHPAADQHEQHALALRAAAVAVLVTPIRMGPAPRR